MIKSSIKKILGESNTRRFKRPIQVARLWWSVIYDVRKYLKSSSVAVADMNKWQLQGHLTVDYHRLEKGLSLANSRDGFGRDVVERLTRYLSLYERKFGYDDICSTVETVLGVYAERQRTDTDAGRIVKSFLATRKPFPPCPDHAGTIDLTTDSLFPVDVASAKLFLESRRSLRQFTGEPVAKDLLVEAARLAQRAPSVCNRQSGRLFVANEPKMVAKILSFQNGNRGFGHTVGAIFVVTSDMRSFTSVGERNQAFVDGGVFAMMLIEALHSLHIGAVMLNWSVTGKQDRTMREALGIPDYNAVIMMVGCGYAPESFKVAASPRLRAEQVVEWLGDTVI